MTRDALVELREKVRAAKGPDREIDARVHQALFGDQDVLMDAGSAGRIKRKAVWGKLRDFSFDGWEDWEAIAGHVYAPRFTASIDSALALVERLGLPWIVILREAYQLCSADLKRLPKAIIEAALSALIEQEPHHG